MQSDALRTDARIARESTGKHLEKRGWVRPRREKVEEEEENKENNAEEEEVEDKDGGT